MTERFEQLGLTISDQLDNAVFTAHNAHNQLFYWVDHPKGKALIAAYGAHIISYHPTSQPEQLWLSHTSELNGKAAIRGGIPLCWPWFGNAKSPNHGYARINQWTLDQISTNEERTEITLKLDHRMIEQSEFEFKLECKFTVAEKLTVELTTYNQDKHPISISSALHSYLATDRDSVKLSGMGNSYQDKAQDFKLCKQAIFELSEQTDRIYTSPQSELELTHGNGRKLHFTHQGEDAVVVWNPGDQLASTIADIHPGGASEYLCVEVAKTLTPADIAPGEHYCLKQEITPS